MGFPPNPEFIGKRYGRLTVVQLSPRRTVRGKTIFQCLCDCGKFHLVARNALKYTQSCGCLRQESMRRRSEERWKLREAV